MNLSYLTALLPLARLMFSKVIGEFKSCFGCKNLATVDFELGKSGVYKGWKLERHDQGTFHHDIAPLRLRYLRTPSHERYMKPRKRKPAEELSRP